MKMYVKGKTFGLNLERKNKVAIYIKEFMMVICIKQLLSVLYNHLCIVHTIYKVIYLSIDEFIPRNKQACQVIW